MRLPSFSARPLFSGALFAELSKQHGSRVLLRRVQPEDYRSWRELRSQSQQNLVPFEPDWPRDALAPARFVNICQRARANWLQDRGYNFHIFSVDAGALLGGIELADVRRGARQSAVLGYWLGTPYVGMGFMREAAKLMLDFSFNTLKLRRLEASCMPENLRSLNLLAALGFQKIGIAKNYLTINQQPRDHWLLECHRSI